MRGTDADSKYFSYFSQNTERKHFHTHIYIYIKQKHGAPMATPLRAVGAVDPSPYAVGAAAAAGGWGWSDPYVLPHASSVPEQVQSPYITPSTERK